MAVFLFADRRFEGDGLLRDLQDLAHLVDGHVHLGGDLFGRGVVAELLQELTGHADDLVDGLDHMNGDTDGARLVSNGASDGLTDPPRRVGRELVALGVVELFDGLDEAEVALLNEVEEQHAAAHVALSDGHDETQVRLGQALLGALALLDGRFECLHFLFAQLRAVLFGLFELLLGLHARGHRGRERNFLVRRQQRHLTDLLEVHAHGVVSREAVDQLVRVDELFLFDLGDLLHRRLHIVDVAVDGLGGADVDAERFERVVDLVELLALKVHLVDGLHQVAGAELALGLALGKDLHELFAALQQRRRGQGGDQLFIQRGILLRGLFRLRGILVRFLGHCGLFRFLRQLDLLKIRLGEQRVGLFLQLSAGQLFFFHVCFPPLPLYLFFSIAAIRGSSLTAARLCASSKMILQ